MKIHYYKILLISVLSFGYIYSQPNPMKVERGKVFGKVFDYDSKHSIEYANIVVLSQLIHH